MPVLPLMKTHLPLAAKLRIAMAISLLCTAAGHAADFDGDGVADAFSITRDSAKAAKVAGVTFANPWEAAQSGKGPAKGVGLLIKLTREPRTYLLNDADYFKTPMWLGGKPPVTMITKKDRRYAAWKKQVPALQADAIQLGTEAGIDILLYWNGKQWRVFWPKEEP